MSPFLKILMDAEAAANAASIQLVSFKEALENEFSVCWHLNSRLTLYLNLTLITNHCIFAPS